MRGLSAEQAASYRRDGFLAPVPVLDREETARYRRALEAYEARLGAPLSALAPVHARRLHVLEPWAAELVRHPAVLDAVEDLIGPDILVYHATFFIKEAHHPGITAWHQDSTYFGLEPHAHVSAWVALSEASVAAGCMEFVPGSTRLGQLRHAARAVANSINVSSQTVVEPFDPSPVVPAPLAPGEMSCHHTLVLHRSGPNHTDDRRIGFGISYIPAHVRHTGSTRMPATLVRGRDRHRNFEPEPDPRGSTPEVARAAHAAAYRAFRAGYEEQMARAAPATPPGADGA